MAAKIVEKNEYNEFDEGGSCCELCGTMAVALGGIGSGDFPRIDRGCTNFGDASSLSTSCSSIVSKSRAAVFFVASVSSRDR